MENKKRFLIIIVVIGLIDLVMCVGNLYEEQYWWAGFYGVTIVFWIWLYFKVRRL